MHSDMKVCIDRRRIPKAYAERLALLNGFKWKSGDILRVRFLDGEPALHEKVKKYALQWKQYANLNIYFGDDQNAAIRISFRPGGSWSTVGRDCFSVTDLKKPTMNFGWLTTESTDAECSRVVLHEFGHALGCIHEHQNPTGGIPWNKPAVYAYYRGEPNFWSDEEIDSNIFQTYAADLTSFTDLDKDSIMIYPIPKEFTLGGFEVGWNSTLSPTDIDFIHKMYP